MARRWTPLPGARSAPGAAPEAPPEASGADPRNPHGPPKVHVRDVFPSSGKKGAGKRPVDAGGDRDREDDGSDGGGDGDATRVPEEVEEDNKSP